MVEPAEEQKAVDIVAEMENLNLNEESHDSQSSNQSKKKKSKKKATKGDGPSSNLRSKILAHQAQQKKVPRVGYVFDEIMTLHKSYTESHPERPERIMAIYL